MFKRAVLSLACFFLLASQASEAGVLGKEEPKLAGAGNKTLAGDVLGALQNDTSLAQAGADVQVTADNGDVELAGTVPSEEDKIAMEKKAGTVSGVVRVINHLRITEIPAK